MPRSRAATPTRSSATLAPGAIVWHNHDRKEVDARENMAAIAMLCQIVDGSADRASRCSRRSTTASCCSSSRGARCKSNGNPFEMHNCLIVTTTDDGLISRIDEYVDPTVGAQLA